MDKITTKNFPSLLDGRSIGFNRMFDLLDTFTPYGEHPTYPPYNVVELGADHYVIEIAIAGFNSEDLTIVQDRNSLTVGGRKPDFEEIDESRKYLHRGISQRAFTRKFVLADHVNVEGAEFKDGMVSISLLRTLPEELKPREIEIKMISSKK